MSGFLISDVILAYFLLFIGIAIVAFIHDRLQDHHTSWHLSKSRLMTCRKCGKIFLLKRMPEDTKCPYCGERSVKFRLPHAEFRRKIK